MNSMTTRILIYDAYFESDGLAKLRHIPLYPARRIYRHLWRLEHINVNHGISLIGFKECLADLP